MIPLCLLFSPSLNLSHFNIFNLNVINAPWLTGSLSEPPFSRSLSLYISGSHCVLHEVSGVGPPLVFVLLVEVRPCCGKPCFRSAGPLEGSQWGVCQGLGYVFYTGARGLCREINTPSTALQPLEQVWVQALHSEGLF